jgi:hypothetical protein
MAPTPNWRPAKLNATKSNRSAIGARALVRYGGHQQLQEVTGQAGFLSVNDRRLHFGLGPEQTADVEVHWPSGIRQSFKAVASNHLITIDETRGIVDARALGAQTHGTRSPVRRVAMNPGFRVPSGD